MTTRTVVCPECTEPLPYGRLACPACGALLASVAGVARGGEVPAGPSIQAGASTVDDEQPLLIPDDEQGPASFEAETHPGRVVGDALPPPAPPAEPHEPGSESSEPDPALDGSSPAGHAPEPAPHLPAWPEPPAMPSVLRDWTGPDLAGELDTETPVDEADAAAMPEPVPTEAPAWPADRAASAAFGPAEPTAPIDAVPVEADSPAPAYPPAPPYPPAGAYMPPSAVFAPEPDAAAAPNTRPGNAPLLADLPFDAPDDLPGWLVASGAAIATIGFFLPWAHRLIASSGEGYFSAWGLGALMHLPLFAATVVTLGLAVLPNRVAGWLRAGVLPLVLGGLLLGLAWPYVFIGPLRGQFGSVLEAFAGLILVVGGILALRPGRHADRPPRV